MVESRIDWGDADDGADSEGSMQVSVGACSVGFGDGAGTGWVEAGELAASDRLGSVRGRMATATARQHEQDDWSSSAIRTRRRDHRTTGMRCTTSCFACAASVGVEQAATQEAQHRECPQKPQGRTNGATKLIVRDNGVPQDGSAANGGVTRMSSTSDGAGPWDQGGERSPRPARTGTSGETTA